MSRQNVACWDIFEFSAQGPSRGNPFVDVAFDAVFSQGNRKVKVPGHVDAVLEAAQALPTG